MDQHSAELYRAGEKMREWFVDHWQPIAKLLGVASQAVDGEITDSEFRKAMVKVVRGLEVVDPEPRLVAFDKQLNKWRGATMEAVADVVAIAKPSLKNDPQELLGSIVLLNARLTTRLAKVVLNEAKPSEVDEIRGMVDNLEELSKEGAPWQE